MNIFSKNGLSENKTDAGVSDNVLITAEFNVCRTVHHCNS